VTTSMVDWTVALNTATKLVKPGPEIYPPPSPDCKVH